MLTLPAIAQRSANLGVTIIENVCHPVPRCPNDQGLFITCRPVCPSLTRLFAIGSDRLTANPPLLQFVSAALERSRGTWGSNHVQYLHFCLRGFFFSSCNCGVVVCPCMYVPVTAARAFSTSLTGRYRVVYDN